MRLTFDDGPDLLTGDVLDALAEHGRQATFFLVGCQVAARGELVRRIVADGHVVGNHSWDHPSLPSLADGAIVEQLRRTSDAIEAACGVRPAIFRPPYGARDARVDRAAAALGMQTLLWDVDPADWSNPGVEPIAAAIRAAADGEVVLLHDGRGDRRQTLAAVRLALGQLAGAGTSG